MVFICVMLLCEEGQRWGSCNIMLLLLPCLYYGIYTSTNIFALVNGVQFTKMFNSIFLPILNEEKHMFFALKLEICVCKEFVKCLFARVFVCQSGNIICDLCIVFFCRRHLLTQCSWLIV